MADKLNKLFAQLAEASRLLFEVELKPLQGDRFQPTGFPDLGAATYKRADNTPMLLVESAQSMANRMELVCWNDGDNCIIKPLAGLPHVVVDLGNGLSTSSIQEAHRINSSFIIKKDDKTDKLRSEIVAVVGDPDSGPLDIRRLARAVFHRDVGAVLHGVFLEKIAGRLRLQRLLSSFIEGEGVSPVTSGGVKLDHVDPSGDANKGYGNVPFTRTEFTAKKLVAYFNLDLATLHGYSLGDAANRLLIALALYKSLKVLDSGMRLRTACDLEARSLTVTRPQGIELELDLLAEVEVELPRLIASCEFDRAYTPLRLKGQIPPRKKSRDSIVDEGVTQ